MTMDDVKEAYIAFLKAENAVEEFSRECGSKEEAMDAEADRMVLIIKSDIAEKLYRNKRHEYMATILGDQHDHF